MLLTSILLPLPLSSYKRYLPYLLLSVFFSLISLNSAFALSPPEDTGRVTQEGTQNHLNYFRLALNTVSGVDASVNYHTRDGSAQSGLDYIATSGIATIRAGEIETFIGVEIIADSLPEADETFSLVLTNPNNGLFPNNQTEIVATHTIVSHDQINDDIVINPSSSLSSCLEEKFGHSPTQTELQTIIRLNCQNKALTNNDIIELGQLNSLTELNIDGNEFDDPSPISHLTQLTSLSLKGDPSNTTQASNTVASANLSEITRIPQANHVTIQNVGLTSVSFLAGLTQLTHLDVSHNQISDISPLASLVNLTELRFEHNHVTDISVLVGLTHLIDVYLTYNCITDFSPIYANGTSTPFINTLSAVLGIFNQSSNCPNCEIPIFQGTYLDIDEVSTVAISSNGTKAFIGDDSSDFKIIDITNPSTPILLGSYPNGQPKDIVLSVDETKAFVIHHLASVGLQIIDISNPTAPSLIGSIPTTAYPWRLALSPDESKVYIVGSKLDIIDITTPTLPTIIGFYDPRTHTSGGDSYGIAISPDGNTAYLSDYSGGFKRIDISDPTNPTFLDYYATNGDANGVTLSDDGTTAYVQVSPNILGTGSNHLEILDVSNTNAITLLGQYSTNIFIYGTALSPDGSKIFITNHEEVQTIDISNPTTPIFISSYNTGVNSVPQDIAISSNNIQIIGISRNTTTVSNRLDILVGCSINTSCNIPVSTPCSSLTIDTTNQDILVNTTTLYDQEFAKVTALNDGGWVITWSSQNSASWNIGLGNWDTYMQRYNSCGVRVGTETLVNTTTTDNQWLQDAITLSDGSYVLLWNHSKTIGINVSNPGIYMQHYSDNSILQGTETLLKSFPTAYPKYSVAELNDPVANSCQSNFVMAWDDYDNADIRMQRYTSSGQLIGNEISSGYTNTSYQSGNMPDASIATLKDGGWVLVWFQNAYNSPNANPSDGVYMQRYNSSGLLVGTITQINTQTSMNWHKSAVIGLQNGGWLVAMPRDGTPIGIRLLQYDANGIQVSSQLIATNHNFGPGMFPISVIELANNDWVVAWSSFGYPANNYASGAYMQRLDSNGIPVGNEIRANQYLANYDFPPSMAALPDGGWVTTWNSFAQDGDRHGVYMKRYDAQGNVMH